MAPSPATRVVPPPLAGTDMAQRLTAPFARGADHLDLVVRGRTVERYDFSVHAAVFGHTPDPLYVLQARKDIAPGTTVTFTVHPGGTPGTFDVLLPDGLLAGTTAPLPRFTGWLSGIETTAPAGGSGTPGNEEKRWRLTALLGTMGKLLWAVGWERDHLRAQARRTSAVRSPRAREVRARVLDLHGASLGVDRSSGESDTAYRRRVELARRWTLPTPAGFAAALNAGVGPIAGTAEPLLVDDTNGPLRRGLLRLRVVPATLLPGQWIDPLGRTGTGPAVPLPEGYFDPYYLADLTALQPPLVDVAPPRPGPYPPGQPPPAPGRVQPAVVAALRRLAPLLTGRARVTSGFDPEAADGRATGRAVLLTHPTTGAGRLAALAHRAGFDVVAHRTDGTVYAECAPGELFVVNAGPGVVTRGQQLTLSVTPVPPPGATVRWRTVHCGPGRGTLAGAADGPAAVLTGQEAGRVVVTAEVRDGPHTLTASREVTVLPQPLADGAAIGADGTVGPADPAAGVPLDPVFLARHDDPAHVDYGADPNHHRMRREVARLLDGLVALLGAGGVTGKLVVKAAYEPSGTPLAKEGRELLLAHPGLAPGALAVWAHRAGFTRVGVAGAVVTVRQDVGDLPVQVGATGLTDGVLEVGAVVKLTVSPAEPDVGARGVLVWSTGDGSTSLLTTAPAEMSVRGEHPGPAWVQAAYRPATGPGAYQMTVRLHPDLAGHVLTRSERGRIMHLLAQLRPLGVEVVTTELTGGSP
ncbi:hypothetical protein DMB38_13235 [Streptomyces sp. WAC 06738]|uniref:hypothetical protein n=1 Tax=Streptomyces sp. WAC 06738 TaxID=2203210 RepID=UPI000F6DCB10|nr:hypothetical protein [Streptomyces sp. WAC 06738]AZM46643.1 hypothetical protein DMB38_13235 [Streptomyces sp. WAC 06738]